MPFQKVVSPRALPVAFCLLGLYWIYLLFATQPVVIYDAAGYLQLGKLLMEQGWTAYFKTGPNREPLFPLLISFSLSFQQWTGVSFSIVVKIILMLFLAATMAGVYRILRMLGVGPMISGWASFYTGASPVLLNSTLWLWSEAAAYPWVVWTIIFTVWIWRGLAEGVRAGVLARLALALAFMFIVLTMVKAVAATVFLFYLAPFYFYLIFSAARLDWFRVRRIGLVLIILAGIFSVAIHFYKSLNERYNGQYLLTDRGDWALYGNTVRRLQPLNKDRFNQAVLSVPRLGLCEKFYGRQCVFWTFVVSDAISNQALQKVNTSGYSSEERHQFFISKSLEWMRQHPFQQMGLMVLEGAKMFFWENKLYFVRYPAWLVTLYSRPALIYTLCFGWAMLSLAGLIHGMIAFGKKIFSRQLFGDDAGCLMFTLSFVFWFIAVYTLFFIDIRYAFPIAPLFVILAFYFIHHLQGKIQKALRSQ